MKNIIIFWFKFSLTLNILNMSHGFLEWGNFNSNCSSIFVLLTCDWFSYLFCLCLTRFYSLLASPLLLFFFFLKPFTFHDSICLPPPAFVSLPTAFSSLLHPSFSILLLFSFTLLLFSFTLLLFSVILSILLSLPSPQTSFSLIHKPQTILHCHSRRDEVCPGIPI